MKLLPLALLLLPLVAQAGEQPADLQQTRHTQQQLKHQLNHLKHQLDQRSSTLKKQQALIKQLEEALDGQLRHQADTTQPPKHSPRMK